MTKFVAFLLVVICALASLVPEGAAQIKLNEILADPDRDWSNDGSVDSKLDEWLEVINTGSTPVDLGVYRITDESAGVAFRFNLSGLLAVGATRVVYGSEVVTWQQANGVSAFGLSLNNSGDTVYLYRAVVGDTSVVDSYTFVSTQVSNDRSVGRYPDGGETWAIFDALNPYTGSDFSVVDGCAPSPATLEFVCGTWKLSFQESQVRGEQNPFPRDHLLRHDRFDPLDP